MNKLKKTKGFGLVEALVAVGIIGAIIIGIVGAFHLFLSIALTSAETIKAVYLLEEGLEAVRSIRDDSWDDEIAGLTTGTPYYLSYSGDSWNLSTSQSMIDGTFDRSVIFESVERDIINGAIVSSGGDNDDGTREVTVSVSWLRRGATTTRSITTYITDYFD